MLTEPPGPHSWVMKLGLYDERVGAIPNFQSVPRISMTFKKK